MRGRAWIRRSVIVFLSAIFAWTLLADVTAPARYEEQFREAPSASPSARFLLGTDELGRDRFSRLLYGGRISLLLAPAAALLATSISLGLGILAGYFGGLPERFALRFTDLVASTPSLLLLLFIRALLPLNVAPAVSVTITFLLLGSIGWTSGVRVIAAAISSARESDFIRQAVAAGSHRWRVVCLHISAAVLPVLKAQFWTLIPMFLVAEANLGMLGLGVSEPLPSLGNMLSEIPLTSALGSQPWVLAPALLLFTVLLGLQSLLAKEISS